MQKKTKLNLQLWVALLLTLSGVLLLFLGFWVAPRGVIDNSVLVAFGEASTFAGALFGVDYNYRSKLHQSMQRRTKKTNENEEENNEND